MVGERTQMLTRFLHYKVARRCVLPSVQCKVSISGLGHQVLAGSA